MANDIIFISYDEPNASKNWRKLKSNFIYVQHLHGINGIGNAHYEASKKSNTDFFYIVDGDTDVDDSFKFDYEPHEYDSRYVHIWQSRNPINGLIYGNGGVKMFHKSQFMKPLNPSYVDFSTSLTEGVKIIDEVIATTRFNSSPFNTWRSAFRESCKLMMTLKDSNYFDVETYDRLTTWCEVGNEKEKYSSICLQAAQAGRDFASDHNAPVLINNYAFLKDHYDRQTTQ
jgi:hypothetical protein